MTTIRRECGIVVAILLAVALVGCAKPPTGPERGKVRGKVTLDGQPIANGTVNFVPTGPDGGPAWTTLLKDGQYDSGEIGPVVGKSRVEVRARRQTAGQSQDPDGDWKSGYVEAIPTCYNAQSTLDVDVRSGENTFDFELKSR